MASLEGTLYPKVRYTYLEHNTISAKKYVLEELEKNGQTAYSKVKAYTSVAPSLMLFDCYFSTSYTKEGKRYGICICEIPKCVYPFIQRKVEEMLMKDLILEVYEIESRFIFVMSSKHSVEEFKEYYFEQFDLLFEDFREQDTIEGGDVLDFWKS